MNKLLPALALLLLAVAAQAQMAAPPGPFAGFKSTDKVPVEIVADRMEANLATGLLRFIGHVRAKQGARTIYAESMEVVYTQAGEVVSILALGGVKVNMGDAFASSDRLELDNKKQVIRLIGSPRVTQGKQIITGELIVYEITSERLTVKNPRIEWTPEQGATLPGRAKPKKAVPGPQPAPAPTPTPAPILTPTPAPGAPK